MSDEYEGREWAQDPPSGASQPQYPPPYPPANSPPPPQSAPPPYYSQPPTYPPNPDQPSYPYPAPPSQPMYPYPQGAPPSQPLYPPYGQPTPSYGPPSYGPPGQPGQPASPSYPLYGQPGYPPPSQPLYPQGGMPPQPPQPRKRGLRAWQWVLIAVSGVLVLCCGCGLFGFITNSSAFTFNSTVLNTPVPTDTPTPADTPTPEPTATPKVPGVGDHMALGHDYGDNGNVYYIIHPADIFSSGQQFAYVVNLDQGIGTTQAKLALVRIETGGNEVVVYTENDDFPNPADNREANKFPISDILAGEPPGKYRWQLETSTTVVASATFTYKG
jgi:hypothetical protein